VCPPLSNVATYFLAGLSDFTTETNFIYCISRFSLPGIEMPNIGGRLKKTWEEFKPTLKQLENNYKKLNPAQSFDDFAKLALIEAGGRYYRSYRNTHTPELADAHLRTQKELQDIFNASEKILVIARAQNSITVVGTPQKI